MSSTGGYSNGIPAAIGNFHLIEFGKYAYDGFHAGETQVVSDARTDPRINEAVLRSYETVGFLAYIGVPFVQRGRLVGTVAVHQSGPRQWTVSERIMVEETAQRAGIAVEQARAEAALRESEELRRIALQSSGMGTWKWDTRAQTVQSDSPYQRWGMEPSNQPHSVSLYAHLMNSKGKALLDNVMTKEIAAGELFEDQVQLTSGPNAGRWLQWRGRADRDKPWIINGVTFDITEQKSLEHKLRESEERQAFLLELSDALRPIRDPTEIQRIATRMLGRQLGASRVFYVVVDKDGDTAFIHGEYADGVPHREGRYSLSAFSTYAVGEWRAGRTASTSDVNADDRYSEADRKAYASVSTRAGFGIPLIKEQRLVAILGVNQSSPRYWTSPEVSLAGEVAERTWAAIEISLAETALRESEARFQQFAEASAAGLWIRDADTLAMEFVSPAISTIYGVTPDTLLGNVKHWASLIVPDDRDIALRHLDQARKGDAVVHEFRVQRPSDGAFRWIRDTDFALLDGDRVARVGGIAEDITETKQLIEHQTVLLAELQHRVRNIMGMIRSMANRTKAGAADINDYGALLEGRLLALARVQALLTRQANVGGSLRSIIESEVSAQAHHGGQFELTGPDVTLSPKAVEVLTLAFHELATNALKYGALSVPDGRLAVSWTPIEKRGAPWLALDWIEQGAPKREPSKRRGFGSELIEGRIPYELAGSGKITIDPHGARCHLEFPLKDAESILETDAPQPTTVFGGAIDMTGAPDLTGRLVLIVEDDYYMATDAAAAMRGAGAEVLGPTSSEENTRKVLEAGAPTHAVLDLNLGGGGPRFEVAKLMKERGVPFIFLTGYDSDVIPPEFADVVRLQKPVEFRAIVEAVSRL